MKIFFLLENLFLKANQRKLKNVGVGIYVSEPIKGDCYPNNLNFNAIINDNLIDRMNFVSKTKQEPSSGENNKVFFFFFGKYGKEI